MKILQDISNPLVPEAQTKNSRSEKISQLSEEKKKKQNLQNNKIIPKTK